MMSGRSLGTQEKITEKIRELTLRYNSLKGSFMGMSQLMQDLESGMGELIQLNQNLIRENATKEPDKLRENT